MTKEQRTALEKLVTDADNLILFSDFNDLALWRTLERAREYLHHAASGAYQDGALK